MYIELAKTVSIMLTLGLMHGVFVNLEFRNELSKQISLGLLFGLICIFGMVVPVVVEPGVIFDARSVMISLASAFGGPLVAITSSAIAGAYRLYLGGGGAFVGFSVIIASSFCGLAFWYLKQRKRIEVNWLSLLGLGFLVHVIVAFLFQFLPAGAVTTVNDQVLPAMFLSFLPATVVLGLLMRLFSKRKEEHIELARLDSERQNALKNIVRALSAALEARDPYTAGHSQNVADISVLIGRRLGLSEEQLTGLELGALVHDVGKFIVPTSVLTKQEKLTDDEFKLIKNHASAGDNILNNIDFDWPIREIAAQHHERIDGSGYPLGLVGDEISIEARIVAVADTFDAMALDRPYRKARGHAAAIEVIRSGGGKIYDQNVVDAFCDLVDDGTITVDKLKDFTIQ
ncbi:HD-GYP domain-containing protein [Pseudemcibacter aquimaris]|uniref:HD-GYP domain-containing protein n=1 Tax=Pseudemcibacter aquimaris TaxID=2857064 RepID=UPI0020120A9A|nr:HD domain-containing phosphohydrolase [Pseudemcibacter aquimaris]MCC3862592.1 HD domain-containing protein [Pseudemcibacter aquimaris]WDU57862.1 HD domain-containing protein [Pseudemcibacter aquimaris]